MGSSWCGYSASLIHQPKTPAMQTLRMAVRLKRMVCASLWGRSGIKSLERGSRRGVAGERCEPSTLRVMAGTSCSSSVGVELRRL